MGTTAPTHAGELIGGTAYLDVYRIEGGLAIAALLDLAPQFAPAVERVAARMGAPLSGRVALRFEPAQIRVCNLFAIYVSQVSFTSLCSNPILA